MQAKLPVIQTFKKSIIKFFENFTALLKIASPLIVYIIFENIFYLKMLSIINYEPNSIVYPILNTVTVLIKLILTIIAAISCHRLFLLKEDERSFSYFKISRLEINYILASIVIIIALIVVALLIRLLMGVFSYIGVSVLDGLLVNNYFKFFIFSIYAIFFIPILYFFSRFSLLLPYISLGGREEARNWFWSSSSGNGWRLTFLLWIFPIVIYLVAFNLPYKVNTLFVMVYDLIGLFVSGLTIALLSFSYEFFEKECSENN